MRSITLDELPKWSPWPARILGLEPWKAIERTPEKITEEYDADKYAKCLEYANESNCDIVSLKQFELGDNPEKQICVSYGDDLAIISIDDALREMCILRRKKMEDAIKDSRYVVELGCGYGYNLFALYEVCNRSVEYIGGEFSKNAVEIARSYHGSKVVQFDFLDPDSYAFLDDLDGPITIFTCHALEQIRLNSVLLDSLYARLDKIKDVFHFEPIYGLESNTLLGMMRKRYTEMNGYNRNLLFDLQAVWSDRIKIVSASLDMFGINQLNPTSVIHWRFK